MKKAGKIIGLALVISGIFLIIMQPASLTGAVIDVSTVISKVWFFIGLGLILGGIGIFAVATKTKETLEKIIGLEEFAKRIDSIEPDDKKRSLILDTSLILEYENNPRALRQFLKKYNKRVFVPDSVIYEIKNPYLRKIVEDNTQDIGGYKKYRNIARSFLNKTEKPTIRRELLPYLTGEKKIKSGSEIVRINKRSKRIREIMNEEERGEDWALKNQEKAKQEVIDYLNKHCRVSNTDVDVLAMAINESRYRQHALIGEKDTDFRKAIDLIKKASNKRGDTRYEKISKNLDYVEPYRNQAHKKEYSLR